MAYISRNVLKTDRRLNIGRFLMNLGKSALDSAINVSLKGFTGGKKLYQTIVQERLKDERKRLKLENVKISEEERQLTKMEDIKLQSKTVADKVAGGSNPSKKKIPQGSKEMELQDSKRKTIFIRSRL
ncbi:putative LRR and NB-ARC domains-containing disease resistance protein [Hibiscus syriacus]|uniref:LRR and NB-ARC domains-containing disease resistance protein n=1 Tax=Hibiscus syriacus TaxID=106335 RepID=A0A6A3CBH8_HIBSY|nr:uncharacterized protein LOC120201786 [Hibiscus syriacus]KAE8725957.1 putative LRR and NB-ARC domains-containing disease resistance protein [Hibiscus syriacus]